MLIRQGWIFQKQRVVVISATTTFTGLTTHQNCLVIVVQPSYIVYALPVLGRGAGLGMCACNFCFDFILNKIVHNVVETL